MGQILCPPEDQIAGYLLGTLDEQVAEKLALHLDQCSRCRQKAEQYESSCTDVLLESMRQPAASPYLEEPECQRAVARLLERFSPTDGVPRSSATPGVGQTSGQASLSQLGEYLLMERLGGGGQGEVYKAFHTVLKREVVIKMLPPQMLTDPKMVGRFDREMELVGRLNHPHIVRALDARRLEDGRRFLVMEYIEGCDVGKLLARHRWLRMADACEIARQTALGLQYIYEHGLVHRDIKPANLLLSRQGQVKILDLGLGRFRRHPAQAEPEMTQAGAAVGTADYMAPEQIVDSRDVDIRADIYSLGCTLYKLLTGRAPFELPECRTFWDKGEAHRHRAVVPIQQLRPDIPRQLAEIVHRMLAKNPEDRFATPGEVAEALTPFSAQANLPLLFADSPTPPPPVRTSESDLLTLGQTGSRGSTNWLWPLLAMAAGILIVCGVVLWGPVCGQKLKTLWSSADSSWQVAQTAVPSGQPSAGPQQPLPGAGTEQSVPPGFSPNDFTMGCRKDASAEGSKIRSGSGGQSASSADPFQPSSEPSVSASEKQSQRHLLPPGSPMADPFDSKATGPSREFSPSESKESSKPPAGASSCQPAPSVRIELDRAEPVYYGPPAGPDGRGERIQLTVRSDRPGYLYVLAQEPNGQIFCLFPNAHQPDNQIAPNQSVLIPEAAGSYEVRATPPYGEVVLWAWVWTDKLKPTQFGVASLTEQLFTEVDREAVCRLRAEMRQNPQAGVYTERKIITQPGPRRSSERAVDPAKEAPGPSAENGPPPSGKSWTEGLEGQGLSVWTCPARWPGEAAVSEESGQPPSADPELFPTWPVDVPSGEVSETYAWKASFLGSNAVWLPQTAISYRARMPSLFWEKALTNY